MNDAPTFDHGPSCMCVKCRTARTRAENSRARADAARRSVHRCPPPPTLINRLFAHLPPVERGFTIDERARFMAAVTACLDVVWPTAGSVS